jgi:ABC-type glutathione transport system ATPase component
VSALLEARGLRKSYRAGWRGGSVPALDGVDLVLDAGEVVAVVGESGSGKTTLARVVARLLPPDSGAIRFRGEEWLAPRGRELRRRRRHLQLVFQDPALSLDPRIRIGDTVAEPIRVHRLAERPAARSRAERLLEAVGLAAELAGRFPHELSGGQRQRVAIARALACEPDLVIADEPVASLDAPLRARILALLLGLARERGTALLLIVHDLGLAAAADRIVVLRAGRVVEEGPAAAVLGRPAHPYTAAMRAAYGLVPAGPKPWNLSAPAT